MVRIEQITENKQRFFDLLLLGDEQKSMIDHYLDDGELFVLYDNDLRAVCVMNQVDDTTCELKNIAVYEKYQGKGYGTYLINYVSDHYRNRYDMMILGTGEVPSVLSFYKGCGFEYSHHIKNFFTDNYDHVMVEEGVQLVDMIYLKKDLK